MDESREGVRYFHKHSTVKARVAIILKGISDANDALGISLNVENAEYKASMKELCEKYKFLSIPRNQLNILKSNSDPMKIGMTPKKPERLEEGKKHPIYDVDISYFRRDHLSQCSLFVVAELCNNGKLVSPSITTPRIKALSFFELVEFPITFADLAPDATISLTIYDMNKPIEKGIIGGTCINLFNPKKCLRQGHFSLYIHKGEKGDPSLYTKTIGLIEHPLVREKNKTYAYIDKHSSKELKLIPWLDTLAHETLNKKLYKIDHEANYGSFDICLPVFDFPIIYKEIKYPQKEIYMSFYKFERKMLGYYTSQKNKNVNVKPPIVQVYDPMVVGKKFEEFLTISNPIADKYYLLSRVVDKQIAKELRPSSDELQDIEEILFKPDFNKMSDREKAIIWKYRYYLMSRKEALVKMLFSVTWDDEKETKEALSLLESWAPIELEQAIIMLSALFSMNRLYPLKFPIDEKAVALVRHKAVQFLKDMKDDDLDKLEKRHGFSNKKLNRVV